MLLLLLAPEHVWQLPLQNCQALLCCGRRAGLPAGVPGLVLQMQALLHWPALRRSG